LDGDCFILGNKSDASKDCVIFRGLGESSSSCEMVAKQDLSFEQGNPFKLIKGDDLQLRNITVEDATDMIDVLRDGEKWTFETTVTEPFREGWDLCFGEESEKTKGKLSINEQLFVWMGNVKNMLAGNVSQFNISYPRSNEINGSTPDAWFLAPEKVTLANYGLRPKRVIFRLRARNFCEDVDKPTSVIFDG